MRSKLSWIGLLLVLLTVNASVMVKEQALADGSTVLLELRPVDPRSLMQGDYMVLNYVLAGQIPVQAGDSGTVYVLLSAEGVATDPSLVPGEGRLPLVYRRLDGRVVFDVESYFFQEGQGHFFQAAKYALLKVDRQGRPLLVNLLDAQRRPIEP